MSVYVDDMYTLSLGQFGRMKMSHLIADTKEELLAMVDKIGVNRKWIQNENFYTTFRMEHFDIAMSKRKLAVEHGAIEITWRQLPETIKKICNDRNSISSSKKTDAEN